MRVQIFVYGTLKRGLANHERFCRGFLDIEEATVRGLLYDLPAGFPGLVVPEEDVQAAGTNDYLADAATQSEAREDEFIEPSGEWDLVHGELLTFEDPETRLPALDRLEGFEPGSVSLYHRVLLPARTQTTADSLVWAYSLQEASGVYLPGGRWPGSC